MKPLLGTVVIENQGGGGSSLGAAAVARAQPDGYTILLGGGGALVINPIASSKPPYDPVRDFEPISLVFAHAFALSVHPSLPVRTLNDLVDYARRQSRQDVLRLRGCRLGEPSHRRAVQVAHGAAGHRAHAL